MVGSGALVKMRPEHWDEHCEEGVFRALASGGAGVLFAPPAGAEVAATGAVSVSDLSGDSLQLMSLAAPQSYVGPDLFYGGALVIAMCASRFSRRKEVRESGSLQRRPCRRSAFISRSCD